MTNSFQVGKWRLTFQALSMKMGPAESKLLEKGIYFMNSSQKIKSRRGIGILLTLRLIWPFGEPLDLEQRRSSTLHGSNLDYVWFPSYNSVAKRSFPLYNVRGVKCNQGLRTFTLNIIMEYKPYSPEWHRKRYLQASW